MSKKPWWCALTTCLFCTLVAFEQHLEGVCKCICATNTSLDLVTGDWMNPFLLVRGSEEKWNTSKTVNLWGPRVWKRAVFNTKTEMVPKGQVSPTVVKSLAQPQTSRWWCPENQDQLRDTSWKMLPNRYTFIISNDMLCRACFYCCIKLFFILVSASLFLCNPSSWISLHKYLHSTREQCSTSFY